jgi:hypothetical protein
MMHWIEILEEELEKTGIEYEIKILYAYIELYTKEKNVKQAELILSRHVPVIIRRKVIAW